MKQTKVGNNHLPSPDDQSCSKTREPTTHLALQSSTKRTKAKPNQVNHGVQLLDKKTSNLNSRIQPILSRSTLKLTTGNSLTNQNQHTKEIQNINKQNEIPNDLAKYHSSCPKQQRPTNKKNNELHTYKPSTIQ